MEIEAQRDLFRKGVSRANGTALTVDLATNFVKHVVKKAKKNLAYNVSIKSGDKAYVPVQDWLLGVTDTRTHRSLLARTTISYNPENDGETEELHFLRDDSREMIITISNHRVLCTVAKPEYSSAADKSHYQDTITFTTWSSSGRDAVLSKIKDLVGSKKRGKPKLWMLDQWGSWRQRSDLPPRSLSSVYLLCL